MLCFKGAMVHFIILLLVLDIFYEPFYSFNCYRYFMLQHATSEQLNLTWTSFVMKWAQWKQPLTQYQLIVLRHNWSSTPVRSSWRGVLDVEEGIPGSVLIQLCFNPPRATLCLIEGWGVEGKANETGYIALWAVHKQRRREITLFLRLWMGDRVERVWWGTLWCFGV